MVSMRDAHRSGIKPMESTATGTSTIPESNFLLLLSHRNTNITRIARKAPRDWLPRTAMALKNMAPYIPNLINFDETVVPRKYISGMTMTNATEMALLSLRKEVPGGPYT